MFQVFEDDIPALLPYYNWSECKFYKFEDALIYARVWLGPYFGGSLDGKTGVDLNVNEPYEYDYDCLIEIRQVN